MKIDEIMLAVVPGEEATEEENDIVKKGRAGKTKKRDQKGRIYKI